MITATINDVSVGQSGLGFNFLDLILPGVGTMIDKVSEQGKEKDGDKKSSGTGAIFCPEGQQANPQWAAIDPADRAQAAASGVQACIDKPDKKGGKGKGGKCHFRAGGRNHACTQDGFDRAVADARADAQRGMAPSLVLRIGTNSITLSACVMPGGQVYPGGMAMGMGIIPATMGPGGVMNCPTGYSVARNALNQVVCAPTTAATAAAAKSPSRRSRTRRGSSSRSRIHGIDGSPTMVDTFLQRTGRAPNIPGFEYQRYAPHTHGSSVAPKNGQCPPGSILWNNSQYTQPRCIPISEIAAGHTRGLASEATQQINALRRYVTKGQTMPNVPTWQQRRMPPMPSQIAGAFSGGW